MRENSLLEAIRITQNQLISDVINNFFHGQKLQEIEQTVAK